jgi:hypothetical protein
MKGPSLISIEDMLKDEEALTKEKLGICVTPYQNLATVQLTNHIYAKLIVDQNVNPKIYTTVSSDRLNQVIRAVCRS